MKDIIKLSIALLVVTFLGGCTALETNESLFADQVIEEDFESLDETFLDIEDEEIALGGPGFMMESFDLSRFTSMADGYTNRLINDIGDRLNESKVADNYRELAQVPKDDLMAIMNIELEYMMHYDDGTWTNRRSDYLNGQGYSVSSFDQKDGIYNYEITYNEYTGSYKVASVRYDGFLEQFDYSSESYDQEGVLSYVVSQQFCRDDEGGYYYQALRQSIVDGVERVSFAHFNDTEYKAYIRTATKTTLVDGFSFNLYEKVPENIDMLTGGFADLKSFSHMDGEFTYDPID